MKKKFIKRTDMDYEAIVFIWICIMIMCIGMSNN